MFWLPDKKQINHGQVWHQNKPWVSSAEFCQAIFEEREIREGLGGGGGHRVMIPLL
jgi:hypothetical protein